MNNESQILQEDQFLKKQLEIVRIVAGLKPADDKTDEIIKAVRQNMESTYKLLGMKMP
jgi:hypothetical protein